MESEDKIIERFETIFENNEPKLLNVIKLDASQKKLVESYKEKGLNSLNLAKAVMLLSSIKETTSEEEFESEILDLIKHFKLKVLLDPNSSFYDWVIEISYYAMYDIATAAIAKEGFKSSTHYTTRLTLEYLYCIKGKDRTKLFKIYDRVLLRRELIKNLEEAQEKREIARYNVTENIGSVEAQDILEDANDFINEIIKLVEEGYEKS